MKKAILTILLLLAMLLPQPFQALAAPVEQPGVVIFLVDKLTLDDLSPETTPFLWELSLQGGIGLLNATTGGTRNSGNSCVTISAGKPATAVADSGLNYAATELVNGEPAGKIYTRYTGVTPLPNNIVVQEIEKLKRFNEEKQAYPGKLGDQVHALGLKTGLLGDSDRLDRPSRLGALLLMDSRGIIDRGVVGEKVQVRDPGAALNIHTDYQALLAESKTVSDCDVVVVEFGDLNRLEAVDRFFHPNQLKKERLQILSNIDNCCRDFLARKEFSGRSVYVLSPSPTHSSVERGELLTPLVVVKPGFQGILSGYSTRREGIVSSLALKNSIVSSLNSETRDTIYTVFHPYPVDFLSRLDQGLVFGYIHQPLVIIITLAAVALALLLAIYLAIRKKHRHWLHLLLSLVVATPLTFLLIARVPMNNPLLFLALAGVTSFLLASLSLALGVKFKIHPLAPLFLATIFTIALDLFFGLGLLENSMMSYRIMQGSRYYGLGNEYMGVLIGATIALAITLLQERPSARRVQLVALLFCGVVFLIAYPRFGINVGGAITACLALGYTYMQFRQHPFNTYKVILLIVGTALLVTIMSVIDLQQPLEYQSHLGRSVTLVKDGGIQAVLNIITRKVEMQLRVINYTMWGWVLIAGVLLALWSVFHPSQAIGSLRKVHPQVYQGLKGIIMAAILAIIFNDSGITAATALLFYFLVILLVYFDTNMVAEKWKNRLARLRN